MNISIGVIGLGYVGLPLALALARKYPGTVGFDLSQSKVEKIQKGIDPTDEGLASQLKSTTLKVSTDPEILRGKSFIIVGVPTPVDINKKPDLEPLRKACETVGRVIAKGAVVCFESTVYPGVTEDFCGKLIAQTSGLTCGVDFKLGYSPERINPGDKTRTIEKVVKVVSGQDQETLKIVSSVYASVIEAGLFPTTSIKVAEAAKVIENTQRDLNIALMNELAIIFDRIGISTKEVLDAASTKWNFIRFSPGLVGGHCIGVDPYYLTAKAEELGYHPQVILAGRRINDSMGCFVAQRVVKLMTQKRINVATARVGILGVTFKENVTDIRNSRVPDIFHELQSFGINPLVHDPQGKSVETEREYGVALSSLDDFKELDALILAVGHQAYLDLGIERMLSFLKKGGVFADVKSIYHASQVQGSLSYWSL